MSVKFDWSDFDDLQSKLMNLFSNCSGPLTSAVMQSTIPELQTLSLQNFNIQTGSYSSGWLAEASGSNSCEISNTAPHARLLEYGFHNWQTGKMVQGTPTLSAGMIQSIPQLKPLLVQFLGLHP